MITCDATGKPALSWHFDHAAIDAEAAADGWYALLANLPPAQASPAEVFLRYKGQHVVERRSDHGVHPGRDTPAMPRVPGICFRMRKDLGHGGTTWAQQRWQAEQG